MRRRNEFVTTPATALTYSGTLQDLDLTARLAEVLHGRSGTLAISWMNFGEYSTVADDEQRRQVERFLDTILPALYCLDGVIGVVTHVRGVHRKPGGFREPLFNIVMGPPLLAPGALALVGGMGLTAAVAERER